MASQRGGRATPSKRTKTTKSSFSVFHDVAQIIVQSRVAQSALETNRKRLYRGLELYERDSVRTAVDRFFEDLPPSQLELTVEVYYSPKAETAPTHRVLAEQWYLCIKGNPKIHKKEMDMGYRSLYTHLRLMPMHRLRARSLNLGPTSYQISAAPAPLASRVSNTGDAYGGGIELQRLWDLGPGDSGGDAITLRCEYLLDPTDVRAIVPSAPIPIAGTLPMGIPAASSSSSSSAAAAASSTGLVDGRGSGGTDHAGVSPHSHRAVSSAHGRDRLGAGSPRLHGHGHGHDGSRSHPLFSRPHSLPTNIDFAPHGHAGGGGFGGSQGGYGGGAQQIPIAGAGHVHHGSPHHHTHTPTAQYHQHANSSMPSQLYRPNLDSQHHLHPGDGPGRRAESPRYTEVSTSLPLRSPPQAQNGEPHSRIHTPPPPSHPGSYRGREPLGRGHAHTPPPQQQQQHTNHHGEYVSPGMLPQRADGGGSGPGSGSHTDLPFAVGSPATVGSHGSGGSGGRASPMAMSSSLRMGMTARHGSLERTPPSRFVPLGSSPLGHLSHGSPLNRLQMTHDISPAAISLGGSHSSLNSLHSAHSAASSSPGSARRGQWHGGSTGTAGTNTNSGHGSFGGGHGSHSFHGTSGGGGSITGGPIQGDGAHRRSSGSAAWLNTGAGADDDDLPFAMDENEHESDMAPQPRGFGNDGHRSNSHGAAAPHTGIEPPGFAGDRGDNGGFGGSAGQAQPVDAYVAQCSQAPQLSMFASRRQDLGRSVALLADDEHLSASRHELEVLDGLAS